MCVLRVTGPRLWDGHQFVHFGRIQWLLILQRMMMMRRASRDLDVFMSRSAWMVLHTWGKLISKPMAAIWNSLQHWKICSAALQLVSNGSCDPCSAALNLPIPLSLLIYRHTNKRLILLKIFFGGWKFFF